MNCVHNLKDVFTAFAGITSDFTMDLINAEIMLLGTNQIAGITSNFKMDVINAELCFWESIKL